ncbi:MAG TPA: 3-hydroxyacyl-CoA dehydrogenase NAD-binding domain-containing protein [Tepidisphaeraceae bacterium]|nr:3-hydroxyacyl-CoA dehydrogenase NAD-binding domain-containing protein [Tepidisphaeraceae bacterium]
MNSMEFFKINIDATGIKTVLFDTPKKPVNTLSPALFTELAEILTEIERDKPKAVIFTSAKKKCFIAGADLFEIRHLSHEALDQFVRDGQKLFTRIAALPMPTVAAINGDCLGGGLELALACTQRVAAAEPSTRIGLPEVMLGIIPGWGGTYRLPHLVGLSAALPLLLTGKTLPPKKALAAGIIDEIVRPEALHDAALRLASSPRKALGWQSQALRRIQEISPLRHRILSIARRRVETQTHNHYPAPARLLDCVEAGYAHGLSAALDCERRALTELSETPTCHNLMRLFFLRQDAKRLASLHLSVPHDVRYAAVIGGGTMGAGIVHALITSGISVRLVEVNPNAVSAALNRVRKMLDDDIRAGRMDHLSAHHAINRIIPTHEWTGLGICDIAIEAVLEKLELKLDVFEKLDRLMPPGTPLASNTSALSIAKIARVVRDPSRVFGMHFFNPVPKMPLVELVRAELTDPAALATGVALAVRLGKTPIVAKDSPGFLVNRVLIPYLTEAALLAAEGISIPTIDAAMKDWGWPMGPFELLDHIGIDVGAEVLLSLTGNVPVQISRMIPQNLLGRKTGKGFYLDGKHRRFNPQVTQIWGVPSRRLSEIEVQRRLMQAMFTEAKNALSEGIVDSPDTIDIASVLGLGFPPFRGGLARAAELTEPTGVQHADIHQRSAGGTGESPGSDRTGVPGNGLRPLDLLRPAETGRDDSLSPAEQG